MLSLIALLWVELFGAAVLFSATNETNRYPNASAFVGLSLMIAGVLI